MSLVIPLFNDLANYSQEVVLDEKSYLIEIHWNSRAGQWFISFLTTDEIPLLMGVPAVLNYSLLQQFSARENVPQGALFCIDTTGKETAINRDNFGKTIQLVYTEKAEF